MIRTLKEWEEVLKDNSLTNSSKLILRDWKEQIQSIIDVLEGIGMIYPEKKCTLESFASALKKDIR